MGNPFRRANLRYRLPHKRVKYRVLTLFSANFVAGAPVRKPKYWKYWHHDGDTSRYQEIQFRYRSVRKCLTLQVNRFAESFLLIVQYRYLKSFSGDFFSISSAQDHALLVLLLNLVGFFISNWQNLSNWNDLYWQCTIFEKAFRRGRPLNI